MTVPVTSTPHLFISPCIPTGHCVCGGGCDIVRVTKAGDRVVLNVASKAWSLGQFILQQKNIVFAAYAGYVNVKVMHRDYMHDPIYNVDVSVSCPPEFQIDFAINADHQEPSSSSKIVTELSDGITSLKLIPFLNYDDPVPLPIVPKGWYPACFCYVTTTCS